MASLQERVIGVLRLDAATFEEVEADASATSQAAAVVAIGAISSAIGAFVATPILGVIGAIVTLCVSFVSWIVGSIILWLVGTKILPGKNTQADIGQLLRTAGFAQAPSIFGILRVIPVLGLLIGLVLSIWGLVAMVIGVKAALDYDDFVKPIIVCLIAWVIGLVLLAIPAMLFAGGLLMAGAAAAR